MYHFVCRSKACWRGLVQLLWCRVSFKSVHSRCSRRTAASDSVCTVTGRMQSLAETLRLMRWHRRVNDSHNSQVKLTKSTQPSSVTSQGDPRVRRDVPFLALMLESYLTYIGLYRSYVYFYPWFESNPVSRGWVEYCTEDCQGMWVRHHLDGKGGKEN